MPERSELGNNKKLSRRSLLGHGLRLSALGVVVAGGSQIKDTNTQIESLGVESQITPIFGWHATYIGQKDIVDGEVSSVPEKGSDQLYTGKHGWPRYIEEQVRDRKPKIIAVDSGSYTAFDPESETFGPNDFYFFPGNPFELKGEGDLFIVNADMPINVLVRHKITYSGRADSIEHKVLDVLLDHYESTIGDDADSDINSIVAQKDLGTYYDRYVQEIALAQFGVGVPPLLWLAAKASVFQKKVSRREALLLGGVSALGFADSGRLLTASIAHQDISRKPWFTPALALPEVYKHYKGMLPYTEFRNALIAVKLIEAEQILKTDDQPMKKVAVMGTFHQFGEPVWHYEQERFQVIVDLLSDIFTKMKEKGFTDAEKEDVVRHVAVFFGQAAIFGVGDEPEVLSVKKVSKAIAQVGTFTSPTISYLTRKAAEKAEFITPGK